MASRVSPQAEADLDDIWLYVARNSGSLEIANRLVDSITDRVLHLVRFPYIGRARDRELGSRLRTFPVGEYVIVYFIDGPDVSVLRVVHGRRDLEKLFNS